MSVDQNNGLSLCPCCQKEFNLMDDFFFKKNVCVKVVSSILNLTYTVFPTHTPIQEQVVQTSGVAQW